VTCWASVTLTAVLLLCSGGGAEYCNHFVCLSASISLEPLDWSSRFFSADPLWLWLDPPLAALRYVMYCRFYGWRHVWPLWAAWRCVEGWTFNFLPLAALRYGGGVWCLWMPCYVYVYLSKKHQMRKRARQAGKLTSLKTIVKGLGFTVGQWVGEWWATDAWYARYTRPLSHCPASSCSNWREMRSYLSCLVSHSCNLTQF